MSSFSQTNKSVAGTIVGIIALGGLVVLVMAVVVWGTALPQFALWKFMLIFPPLLTYALFFLLSTDKLQFFSFSIIILWPFLGILIPPKRLGISLFDVMMLFGAGVTAMRIMAKNSALKIVPNIPVLLILISILPPVAFALDPMIAFVDYARYIGYYILFIIIASALETNSFQDKLPTIWSAAAIVVSIFIFIEHATGINFSFSVKNLNALSYLEANTIVRSGGLFQDPQKAAQFLAVSMAVLTVLWARRTFCGKLDRWLIPISVLLSGASMMISVSRLAIGTGALATFLGFFFFGRHRLPVRFAALLFPVLLIISMAVVGNDSTTFGKLVPKSLELRFLKINDSARGRYEIWKNSWKIFKEKPIFGIGPGNYQEFLMREDPRLRELKAKSGYVPNQPESGYLKILYESGLFSILFFVFFLIATGQNLFKRILLRRNNADRSWAIAVSLGLFVFLSTFLTLFTVSDGRNAFLAIMLFSLATQNSKSNNKVNGV